MRYVRLYSTSDKSILSRYKLLYFCLITFTRFGHCPKIRVIFQRECDW